MLVKVLLLLLLLPAIVYSRIYVRVKAGKNKKLDKLEYSGSIVEIIPDKERESWKIDDVNLKDAAKLFSGSRPTDVFVKSPTPWDDLYTRFGWKQVQRTLIAKSATIDNISSHPVIVTTQVLVNNGTDKATYNTGTAQTLTDTVSSTWAGEKKKLQIGQENTYEIEFDSGEVGGTSSISYNSTFEMEVLKRQEVTVGSTSGVPVELEPGQSVIATLTATRRYMEVQVDYSATLSGDVACNYAKKFDGHNFYAYGIDDCLEAAKLPSLKETFETIQIGFYSDAKVTVFDKESQALIAEEEAPVRRK